MKANSYFNNKKAKRFVNRLIRCLYPERCDICGKIVPLDKDYCDCRYRRLRRIKDDFCHHCGRNIEDCNCSAPNSVYLPEIAAVYYYSGVIRREIIDFKFYGKKHLVKHFGLEMAERCRKVYGHIDFDVVTFVPMGKSSYKERGYNQSQLLANYVGATLFVPTKGLLKKVKKTENQHKLSGRERTKNLRDSIAVIDESEVKGKNILICDDVKTTGATLAECVELLRRAGAVNVCCLCAAVTKFSVKRLNISRLSVNNNLGDNFELFQQQLR